MKDGVFKVEISHCMVWPLGLFNRLLPFKRFWNILAVFFYFKKLPTMLLLARLDSYLLKAGAHSTFDNQRVLAFL